MWFHAVAAMDDYYNANFEDAIVHTAKSRELAKPTNESVFALAHLIDAMCHQRLQDSAAAKESLAAANQLIERNAVLKGEPLPGDWYNWLICLIIQREAKRVVRTMN